MGRTTFPGSGVGGGVAVSVGGKGEAVNVAVGGRGEEVAVDVVGITVAAAGAGEQLTSRARIIINGRLYFIMFPEGKHFQRETDCLHYGEDRSSP